MLIYNHLMKTIILLICLIALATNATLPLVAGGYQPYKDYGSQEYQKVLAFVKVKHPILSSLNAVGVQRQLVNGYNYRLSYRPWSSCEVEITVYATFQQQLSQSEYRSLPANCINLLSAPKQVFSMAPPLQMMQAIAGGYSPSNDSPNEQVKSVLAYVRRINPYLNNIIPSIQTQVVAGINYKMTFKVSESCSVTIVVYRNLNKEMSVSSDIASPAKCNDKMKTSSPMNPMVIDEAEGVVYAPFEEAPIYYQEVKPENDFKVGGYSAYTTTSSAQFQKVLALIMENHPELKNISPTKVQTQVVSGFNFKVLFQISPSCSLSIVIYQTISGELSETSSTASPDNCNQKETSGNNLQDNEFVQPPIQQPLRPLFGTGSGSEGLPPIQQPERSIFGGGIQSLPPMQQPVRPIFGGDSQSLPPMQMPVRPLSGGFQDYPQTNSQQFEKILTFIRGKHPELSSISPNRVQRQLVNGFNYKVTFSLSPSCSQTITVYSTFQGALSETSFQESPPKCFSKQPISGGINPNLIAYPNFVANPNQNMNGAYQKVSDWKSARIVKLLSFLTDNYKKQIGNAMPKDIQSQVVNGINYRITYSINNASNLAFEVYSTFSDQFTLISYSSDNAQLTHPDVKKALAFAISAHPYLNLHRLVSFKLNLADKCVELSFRGNDRTAVKTVIDLKSTLLAEKSFSVSCQSSLNNCNDKIASNIYKANEDLLKKYANLKTFVLSSFQVYERPSNVQVIVEVFTNKLTSQTSLVTFMITESSYRLLNYVPIKA